MSDRDPEAIEREIEKLREAKDEEGLAKVARLHIEKYEAQKRQFKASLARRKKLLAGKEKKP